MRALEVSMIAPVALVIRLSRLLNRWRQRIAREARLRAKIL
jgi:hypothetical protein